MGRGEREEQKVWTGERGASASQGDPDRSCVAGNSLGWEKQGHLKVVLPKMRGYGMLSCPGERGWGYGNSEAAGGTSTQVSRPRTAKRQGPEQWPQPRLCVRIPRKAAALPAVPPTLHHSNHLGAFKTTTVRAPPREFLL